jgi:murein DD-endopeptidase MepM/ murein hydrolase activator NlpD
MPTYTLLSALFLAFFCLGSALAEETNGEEAPDQITDAQRRSFSGNFEHVVCIKEGRIGVRDSGLSKVLFTAENFAPVKLFQGEGKKRLSNGRDYIKVQFPTHQESTGWVSEKLVRPRSRCLAAPQYEPIKVNDVKKLTSGGAGDRNLRGLSDPNCCHFPTKDEPTHEYTTEQRRFGANRGERLHAACDLYRPINEQVYAVADGTVIRAGKEFFQGTYALEVLHSGGFVVRYAEITKNPAPGIKLGAKVKMGQVIGYVGKVNSGCCKPMLHFELYSGAQTGSLTTGRGKYHRRTDLLDPTKYLQKWQATQFKSRK